MKLGKVRPTKQALPSTDPDMMHLSPIRSLTSSLNRRLAQEQTSDLALLANSVCHCQVRVAREAKEWTALACNGNHCHTCRGHHNYIFYTTLI